MAEAAAAAGIETLFTSEPTAGLRMVNGCRVPGRYAVERGMGPEWSAGFAAGKLGPHLQRALLWKAKALAKAVGGPPLSAATRGYTEEGLIWLIRSLV